MAQYVVIPPDWADSMEGKEIDPNIFRSSVTADGRRVVSANAINDFEDDFAELETSGVSLIPIELGQDDFPYFKPKINCL